MATVRRVYSDFRGVDFRGEEVSLQRSPDSVNLWRSYADSNSIRTRPGMALHTAFPRPIYGIYSYDGRLLIHSGTGLYQIHNGKYQMLDGGLVAGKSCGFCFGGKWYFLDGKNYLYFNGKNTFSVEGHVPTTSIGRAPAGGGTVLEDVNLLSDYRINTFLGDGESREFHLDAENIDADYRPVVTADGEELLVVSVDWEKGVVTVAKAPGKPATDGQDNVSIRFKKHVPGNRERIQGCSLVQLFDNRVFVSGNKDYPNTLWHCSLDDPTYFSDLDYYREGMDNAAITGMVAGNNALWVFRESGNTGTNVFYHTPALDADYGKIYPSAHTGVTMDCLGAAINFLDDMVFFSSRGMEAVTGNGNAQQTVTHRSSLVDRKLLAEPDYRQMLLEIWEGYLLIIVGDKVYLADSRQTVSVEGHREYEFFYWQLEKKILCARVVEGILYLGTEDGLYTLTNDAAPVESWWTTPPDRFGQPGRWKTLDGRPGVAEVKGQRLRISAKSNKDPDFDTVGEFDTVTDAAVFRVKKKKCKDLRLKFSSPKGFCLETVTVEAQIGDPVKRA